MKKAMTNYVVDLVIAAAFIVAAVSGIVFLLPTAWVAVSPQGDTSLLGVSMELWSALHEWSALIMIGGAVLHVVLHWRWVVTMTRRTFRMPTARRGARRLRTADVASAAPMAASMATAKRSQAAPARRFTRKAFLTGAAATCGGLVALAVLSRGEDTHAVSTNADAAGSTTGQGRGGGNGYGNGNGGGAGALDVSPEQPSSGEGEVARVTIAQGRCDACGACLSACPRGVFSVSDSGGAVVASAPDACTLCGRCVRACPTGAIALNG